MVVGGLGFGRSQRIVTHRVGGDPVGDHDERARPGRRRARDDELGRQAAPGAIETDVQWLVRAWVTTPDCELVIPHQGEVGVFRASSPGSNGAACFSATQGNAPPRMALGTDLRAYLGHWAHQYGTSAWVSHTVDSRCAGLIPKQEMPGPRDRRKGVRRRYQGRPVTVAPATPRLIDRGDHLDALDRAAASKVTIISAPAGSGKTSLLRAWAGRPGRPHRLALVQVRRDQHDAQQFWLALLDAIRHATGVNGGAEFQQ